MSPREKRIAFSRKKKIVITICALLIFASVAGAASFAWFTMNDRVDAYGMELIAVTGNHLLISRTENEADFDSFVDFGDTGIVQMTSSSTVNGTDWFVPEPNAQISYKTGKVIPGSTYIPAVNIPATEDTPAVNYYRKETVYIKASLTQDTIDAGIDNINNLYISDIAIVGSDDALNASLRVGFVCGDSFIVFAYSSLNASIPLMGISDTAGTEVSFDSRIVNAITGEQSSLLAGSVSHIPTQVDIYIWYEGLDDACTSVNATAVDSVEVKVEFRAGE